ncbi:hypothetical protein RHMOL_Rhmol01G0010300 [Rhododendron molle]|uniref:Uncharacterized protein n=1 Tax=Rhododendron molle TaxID=49168 RepID=A0ACC0PY77_RHOML|nr:hypothetical protein RHMOL_Rhmol01G0010300 [Rhododendron molle]
MSRVAGKAYASAGVPNFVGPFIYPIFLCIFKDKYTRQVLIFRFNSVIYCRFGVQFWNIRGLDMIDLSPCQGLDRILDIDSVIKSAPRLLLQERRELWKEVSAYENRTQSMCMVI